MAEILVDRATREGFRASVGGAHDAFYRLTARERFVLSALHARRWRYARAAKVLRLAPQAIAEIAWRARTTLAPGLAAVPASPGARCPKYLPDSPWTQRFLDEELTGRERFYLQNHLMACEGCRRALAGCRDLYFKIDERVPRAAEGRDWAGEARRIRASMIRFAGVPDVRLGESLRVFLGRPEVFAIGVAVLAAILWSLK